MLCSLERRLQICMKVSVIMVLPGAKTKGW